jgi:hypothetical protein
VAWEFLLKRTVKSTSRPIIQAPTASKWFLSGRGGCSTDPAGKAIHRRGYPVEQRTEGRGYPKVRAYGWIQRGLRKVRDLVYRNPFEVAPPGLGSRRRARSGLIYSAFAVIIACNCQQGRRR